MAKLLTPGQLKQLKKGTLIKEITGRVLKKGIDKVYYDDLRFGLTPYSIFKQKKTSIPKRKKT